MNENEIRELVEAQQARNAELRTVIESSGGDPAAPATIDVFFYAADESDARRLAAALESEAFREVNVTEPHDMVDAWSVTAELEMSVDEMINPLWTDHVVRLAAGCNAEYDGWGTAV